MGAMRLPRSHSPAFDLISYVNSELKEMNSEIEQKNKELEQKGQKLLDIPHPLLELREYFYDSRDAVNL